MRRRSRVHSSAGEDWAVEYRESAYLTQMDGFLVSYGVYCCITLRATLDTATKRAGARALRQYVATLPVGTPMVHLWSQGDPPRNPQTPGSKRG